MGVVLLTEKQILDSAKRNLKPGEKVTVRRQHCKRCTRVLAFQVGVHLDQQSQLEYYVIRDCLWLKGEPHLLYERKRWFGNLVVCPVCGNTGKLPMDKPLNWELMQQSRELVKEGKHG